MRLPLTPTIVLSNGRLIGSRYKPNDSQELFDLADPERTANLDSEELHEAMTAIRKFRSLKTTTELLNSHLSPDGTAGHSKGNWQYYGDITVGISTDCQHPATPPPSPTAENEFTVWASHEHESDDLIESVYKFSGEFDLNLSWEEYCSNLRLMAMAQSAPHDCGDPTCPGVINKHKLEHVRHLEMQIELTQRLLNRQTELAQQVVEAFGLEFAADADPVIEILHLLAVTGQLAKQEQA